MEPRDVVMGRLTSGSFDLLVVGGGITGAGVALDAAARGLRVALLERDDFASGTSSRSTKLVHGGVRYLAQRDIHLVREALAERDILLRLAPHLVHPQPFVLPVYRGQHVPGVPAPAAATRALTSAGLAAYDLLAGARGLQRRRSFGPTGARGLVPYLRKEGLRGAYLYYDARTDDVRLVLAVLGAAVERNAAVANHIEAVGFERAGGRLAAVRARDRIAGADITIEAARIVNATGAWSASVSAMGGKASRPLRLSKGAHVVLDRAGLPLGPLAVVLPTTADGRLAFVVPWGQHMLLGTTDTPFDGDPAVVLPRQADVDALLGDANRYLDVGLRRSDVISAFAGLRPLVASHAATTAATSREHVITIEASGLVSVSGGKLTTYRRMARDAVDAALEAVPGPWGASSTGGVALRGASGLRQRAAEAQSLAAALDIPTPATTHLIGTYGADATRVLELAARDPGLAEPLVAGLPYLRAEVVYGARCEAAQSPDDVLRRRTRIALEDRDGGRVAAADVAALLAAELGWDAAMRERALAAYLSGIATERAAWAGGQ